MSSILFFSSGKDQPLSDSVSWPVQSPKIVIMHEHATLDLGILAFHRECYSCSHRSRWYITGEGKHYPPLCKHVRARETVTRQSRSVTVSQGCDKNSKGQRSLIFIFMILHSLKWDVNGFFFIVCVCCLDAGLLHVRFCFAWYSDYATGNLSSNLRSNQGSVYVFKIDIQ